MKLATPYKLEPTSVKQKLIARDEISNQELKGIVQRLRRLKYIQ